ncbi:hypothetical protein F5B17DRAFT_435755 [Nemania serpens]|nr:hypothetical protein F5B17DRAFT_435755 [Nemania serpens]
MSPSQNSDPRPDSTTTSPSDPPQQDERLGAYEVPSALAQAHMAIAFKELARGEQQAAVIEANLARFESKLDALLASFEAGDNVVQQDGEEDSSNKKQPPEKK